jgi:hypothetical protein
LPLRRCELVVFLLVSRLVRLALLVRLSRLLLRCRHALLLGHELLRIVEDARALRLCGRPGEAPPRAFARVAVARLRRREDLRRLRRGGCGRRARLLE